MRHLVSLFELSAADIREILTLTAQIKEQFRHGERPPLLAGRVLTLIFEKPSLRTRVSFEAAMKQLGGCSVFLTSKDAGFHGREALCDIARVLSSYCDAVAMRTFSQQLIDDFARHSSCPVINGLSDERHPCQALTDLFTVQEVFGDLANRKIVFVGDGNNVASSLAIATARLGLPLTICSPEGYDLKPAFLAELKRRIPAADVRQVRDPRQAVVGADVLYTDVWASMGQEAEADERQRAFAPYQVNAELLAHAGPQCRFMHDLPARRGMEVTDDVLDGPQCIAFQQAENRMHLAKGLLVWLMKGARGITQ